jgi:hypothetical protein
MMQSRIPISSPTERRKARYATLRERALALRQDCATYAAIGAALGLSLARAYQIVRKAERLTNSPHWYDHLPMRAQTFLHNAGLTELSEIDAARSIAQLSRRELLATPNFGRGACDALVALLAQHGLTPAITPENETSPAGRNSRPGSITKGLPDANYTRRHEYARRI